jgi:hypothetical protein
MKFTLEHGLKIVMSPSMLVSAFSDAVWLGDIDDMHSIGGFAIYLYYLKHQFQLSPRVTLPLPA